MGLPVVQYDLIGQRFGKLTVVDKLGKNYRRAMMWLCRCDCGAMTKATTTTLRNGHVRSCGCLRIKDRQTVGGKPIRLYRIWKNMKKRCYNANTTDYLYYGARGITVCDEWHDFSPFRAWALENGYTDELTLDRINNDGNYEPANCRWATWKEQAKHRRPNGSVIRNGKPIGQ